MVQRDCNLMQIGGLLDSKGYGIATPIGLIQSFSVSLSNSINFHCLNCSLFRNHKARLGAIRSRWSFWTCKKKASYNFCTTSGGKILASLVQEMTRTRKAKPMHWVYNEFAWTFFNYFNFKRCDLFKQRRGQYRRCVRCTLGRPCGCHFDCLFRVFLEISKDGQQAKGKFINMTLFHYYQIWPICWPSIFLLAIIVFRNRRRTSLCNDMSRVQTATGIETQMQWMPWSESSFCPLPSQLFSNTAAKKCLTVRSWRISNTSIRKLFGLQWRNLCAWIWSNSEAA